MKSLFKSSQKPKDETDNCYTIFLNDQKLTFSQGRKFPNNYIRTTKYTLITFIPKNLFEQFRRVSNFYFLCVLIVQLVPQVSPLLPLTSILPLSFVLLVTAIKEGLEDYRRYQSDQRNNKELYNVVRNGQLFSVYSKDLKVGDILKISNTQRFPADMVLLSSSNEEGLCYVETSNLDGETNLKVRKSLNETNTYQTLEQVSSLRGSIVYETPNERLYRFNGRYVQQGRESTIYSLNHTMFLQRGSQLKNTKHIFGVCVYTGVDTKLYLNQQPPPSKFSTVERLLNKLILYVFVIQMAICLLCSVASTYFEDTVAKKIPYLGKTPFGLSLYGIRNFFTYFILFNTMIPISLWVTLEMVKVGQAKFMEWDMHMRSSDERKDIAEQGAKAKTSNLNEDLGRIQHIFSDKTGTLTENDMRFAKCSIGVDIFDETATPGSLASALDVRGPQMSFRSSRVQSFLRILTLCHTVVSEVEESTGVINYQSQSPDELALVQAAKANGFIFINRRSDEVLVRENGVDTSYALLAVLEFSSSRRRMSVIVRTPEGEIKLLSKGADMAITSRLNPNDRNSCREETLNYLKTFSREGYRTLMLAERDLTPEEYNEWRQQFFQASTAIENREERVEQVCELIEKDMTLVGTTAIEDKLQNQVPETIAYLLDAGLHIWVLTGDKQETAVNIGYSCKLFDPMMELIFVNTETSEECGNILDRYIALLPPEKTEGEGSVNDQVHPSNNTGDGAGIIHIDIGDIVIPQLQIEYGLVIDGHTLAFALVDHKEKFLRLGRACKSVICCRVTPLQKALVVRVVKEAEQKISLAIGDGANDVSMLQEAHVGVGIFGREGTQAARASDYAIHQFQHLKRLLCVHGRFSYIRVAGLIQYSFYKNMSFTLCLLWFSFSSLFTGQTIFDSWIITFYNILFTSLPPFFYGLFERDIDDESIMENPLIYRRLQKEPLLTKKSFLLWNIAGLWHSLVVYFAFKFLFANDIMGRHGLVAGMWTFGTLVATCSILIVNLRMAIEIKTWNIFSLIGLIVSLLSYFIMVMLYAFFVALSPNMYSIFTMELATISYHLTILIAIFIALVPDFMIKYYNWQYNPLDVEILRERRDFKCDIQLKDMSGKRARSSSSSTL